MTLEHGGWKTKKERDESWIVQEELCLGMQGHGMWDGLGATLELISSPVDFKPRISVDFKDSNKF